MTTTVMNSVKALTLVALGLAIGAMGLYVGEVDDAPGAGGLGLLLMVAGIVLGVRTVRNRLPPWAARTAIGVGVAAALFAAVLTRGVVAMAPLFPQPDAVPSATGPTPPAPYTAAADRARALVRAAMLDQNLPGVSVAVGIATPPAATTEPGQPAGAPAQPGGIVWAEGFGWRDVVTETPVTPDTRFHIGTAASAIIPAVQALGLTRTGTDAAKEWSPEAIGEEGEDFPPLTLLRHHVFQPLGLMAMEYPLPGDRATFYVPRGEDHNPRGGRRLMYMRDLACCANGMAFSSTPSDLVRFALSTNAASVNGALAGGMVMSLLTDRDRGVAVAVTSNMAHANTSSLAQGIGRAFEEQAR